MPTPRDKALAPPGFRVRSAPVLPRFSAEDACLWGHALTRKHARSHCGIRTSGGRCTTTLPPIERTLRTRDARARARRRRHTRAAAVCLFVRRLRTRRRGALLEGRRRERNPGQRRARGREGGRGEGGGGGLRGKRGKEPLKSQVNLGRGRKPKPSRR